MEYPHIIQNFCVITCRLTNAHHFGTLAHELKPFFFFQSQLLNLFQTHGKECNFLCFLFRMKVPNISKICQSTGLFSLLKKNKSLWKEIDYPGYMSVHVSLSLTICESLSITFPIIPTVDLESWFSIQKGLWSFPLKQKWGYLHLMGSEELQLLNLRASVVVWAKPHGKGPIPSPWFSSFCPFLSSVTWNKSLDLASEHCYLF